MKNLINKISKDNRILVNLLFFIKFTAKRIIIKKYAEIPIYQVYYTTPKGDARIFAFYISSLDDSTCNTESFKTNFLSAISKMDNYRNDFYSKSKLEHKPKIICYVDNNRTINCLTNVFQNQIPADFLFEDINKLYRVAFNSIKFSDTVDDILQEKKSDIDKFYPIECDITNINEKNTSKSGSALDELFRLVENEKSNFFYYITGSYGTGKTTLLLNLAKKLNKTSNILAIYINVANKVSSGLNESFKSEYNIKAWYPFNVLTSLTNGKHKYRKLDKTILIIDSLDEQKEINNRIFEDFFKEVANTLETNISIITAFRQELFSDTDNDINILLNNSHSVKRRIHLNRLDLKYDYQKSNIILTNENNYNQNVQILYDKLIKMPIWYQIISKLKRSNLLKDDISITAFIKLLVNEWNIREGKTKRIKIDGERVNFNSLIALCFWLNMGIPQENKKITKKHLVQFIRFILPRISSVQNKNLSNQLSRWIELPPDLTAETLAVSNIMKMNSENLLLFEDEFYFFFLSKAIIDIISNNLINFIGEETLLFLFDTRDSKNLLGIKPIPNNNLFRRILWELLRSEFINNDSAKNDLLFKLYTNLNLFKNYEKKILNIDEALINYNPNGSDEEQDYELKIPEPWSQYHNYYTWFNLLSLIQIVQQSNKIANRDFSYLLIRGIFISDTEFVDCQFIGTQFSFCTFKNIKFKNSNKKDFSYALFDNCTFIDTIFEYKDSSSIFYNCVQKQRGNHIIEKIPFDYNIEELEAITDVFENLNWIYPKNGKRINSNKNKLIFTPIFAAHNFPVTNKEFLYFLNQEENKHFLRKPFSEKINNPYYLRLFDENDQNRPVIYISLISAVAYAAFVNRRLPTAVEYSHIKEYNDYLKREKKSKILETKTNSSNYDELPILNASNIEKWFPTDLVLEMTYQIDNQIYWDNYYAKEEDKIHKNNINNIPYYDRTTFLYFDSKKMAPPRCEYLIPGQSYLIDTNDVKSNSKIATWLNPDQTFRCVASYSQIIFDFMHKKNGIHSK